MNEKLLANLLIKILALSGMFLLALIYDSYFIALFFLIGGLLLGVDLAYLIKIPKIDGESK